MIDIKIIEIGENCLTFTSWRTNVTRENSIVMCCNIAAVNAQEPNKHLSRSNSQRHFSLALANPLAALFDDVANKHYF
jgi:hypothetical protein